MASGAGSASRWSLGTGGFGGLVISTISSLLLVPVLYVVIKNLTDFVQGKHPKPPQSSDSPPSPQPTPSRETAGNGNGQKPVEVGMKSEGDVPA